MNQTGASTGGKELVSNVQKYIIVHAEEKITLKDTAKQFHINATYLSSLFSRYSKYKFNAFVNWVKVCKAKKMLMTQAQTVNAISKRLGYSSSFYFDRVFKKFESMTPTEYINMVTKKE